LHADPEDGFFWPRDVAYRELQVGDGLCIVVTGLPQGLVLYDFAGIPGDLASHADSRKELETEVQRVAEEVAEKVDEPRTHELVLVEALDGEPGDETKGQFNQLEILKCLLNFRRSTISHDYAADC
jgi:hypothetical protein